MWIRCGGIPASVLGHLDVALRIPGRLVRQRTNPPGEHVVYISLKNGVDLAWLGPGLIGPP